MIAEAYGKYRAKLYAVALNQTGNKEVAEDIVHDVFCSLLEETAEILNLRAWLYAVTRNAIIDHIRKRDRQQTAYHLLETQYEGEHRLSPEKLLIMAEEVSRIRRASQRLRGSDREILGYVSTGLSPREIADKVNLSEVNVRVRLHRTRRTLQEILA